jgi:rhamnosyl/mannosyltransferase
MKILQIVKLYHPWIGGVEKIAQQISEGLQKRENIDIEVLCCSPRRERLIKEVNGIKVYRASSFGIVWGMPLSLDFFRLFKKIVKQFDIIDFHHPFPLGDLAILLFPFKAKLIVHYHSDIVRQKFFEFLFRPLILHTLKKAKKILVSSPNLIRTSPYLRKFQQKCEVVPFGIEIERFQRRDIQQTEGIREKYGEFILFVGRLNYYKGVQYLIQAIKDIETNLVIIGKGKEEQNLKNLVEKLGIQNKVFFLPHLEETQLINFYQVAKIFVLPSIFRSEAFGIVLIEAMACETPIISTELGTGTSWVNVDGKTGFVVSPRDSSVLTQAIKNILENKNLAQEFGQAGLERVKKEFLAQKMLDRIWSIYSSV